MGSRALGAFLALAAAAAFVVSIVMSTWWAGNPVVDGKLIEAKYVSVGPLVAQGCNIGGDGSCSAIELDQQTQLIAYGELGAAGLATLFLLMLVGAAWRVSDSRKGMSTASLLFTLLAAGGAGALLALGPGIKATQHVEVPIGWGTYVFGGGVLASLLASMITRSLRPEPLRLKPSLSQIPTPAPTPVNPYAQTLPAPAMVKKDARPTPGAMNRLDAMAPAASTPRPTPGAMNRLDSMPSPAIPTPLPIAPYPGAVAPAAPAPAAIVSPAAPARGKPPSTPPGMPSQRMSPVPPEMRSKSSSAQPPMPGLPPHRPSAPDLARTKAPSVPPAPAASAPARSKPASVIPVPSLPSVPRAAVAPVKPVIAPVKPPTTNNNKKPVVPSPSPTTKPKIDPHQRRSTEPGTPPPPESSQVSAPRGSKPAITPPRSATLAHAVPPPPSADTEDDDDVRETMNVTAVEIDAEAKAAAQAAKKGIPRADTDIRTGKNRIREPTESDDVDEAATGDHGEGDHGEHVRELRAVAPDPEGSYTDSHDAQSIPDAVSIPDPTAQTLLAPEPPPPLTRIPPEEMKTREQNPGPPERKGTPIPTLDAPPKLPISTAPTTLPPPKKLEEKASGPTPACPQCESPMAWVEEHLRFYCRSCRMYF